MKILKNVKRLRKEDSGSALLEVLFFVAMLAFVFLFFVAIPADKRTQVSYDEEVHNALTNVVQAIEGTQVDSNSSVRVVTANNIITITVDSKDKQISAPEGINVSTVGNKDVIDDYVLYATHEKSVNYSVGGEKGQKKYDSARGGFIN